MPGVKEKARLTEFGIQLGRFLAKLKEPMTIADYADLTGLSYKYISQLRTKHDRRPGSYAIVKLLKPFVDSEVLTLNEAVQFSKVTRGKILTLGECRDLFPATSERDLRQAINEALQSEGYTVAELAEITIIDDDYSVPLPVIEFIRQKNPQIVKMLEHYATYG